MLKERNKFGRPKRRVLDKDKVSDFLSNLGFEFEEIEQEWRHLLAFGKYQGKEAVFKLASTKETAKRTENEFFWNEAVKLAGGGKNFTVPQNYDCGQMMGLFYFIAQRFVGKLLVCRNSSDLTKIAPRIDQIALATREIETLNIPHDCAFARRQLSKRKKSVGYGLLSSAQEWARQVRGNLNPYLAVIEKTRDALLTCVGHGDFTPRQMYDVEGKIGIIDGEHAGIAGPLYYDVAQFYIHLRKDHDGLVLARKYLEEFKNLLSGAERADFWFQLEPVLIHRYIGCLWGAAKDPQRLKELGSLGQEILENKII